MAGNGELKSIEAGTRLSGGQARRVAIARAFLRDARVLLLDEPSEGLDADNEARVLEALAKLMQGKTTLLVSHRPRALEIVGRVVRGVGSFSDIPLSDAQELSCYERAQSRLVAFCRELSKRKIERCRKRLHKVIYNQRFNSLYSREMQIVCRKKSSKAGPRCFPGQASNDALAFIGGAHWLDKLLDD
ncbi:ATP-binding cassette domain-containing protein [Salinicola sp. V024]|uniref:ATP-binding cassette domain-containing protein n=1 Tax=Salinicola sp. V024 TaxID=3459609 RepID=UPI00404510C2